MMKRIGSFFLSLKDLDRRFIFVIIGLSILIPLLRPEWVQLPVKTTSYSEQIFKDFNQNIYLFMHNKESDHTANVVVMSKNGYQQLMNSKDGENIHWTTDVNVELPIKIPTTGIAASFKPTTIP